MKRLISFALLLSAVLILAGCGANRNEYTPKNSYADGKYTVLSDRYDNSSHLPYMKITVKNSIITNVYFNMIDKKGRKIIKKNSKKDFYIRLLNTSMLQNQNAKIKNPDDKQQDLFQVYRTLAKTGLKAIKKPSQKVIYVGLDCIYTAGTEGYASDGFKSQMSVTYENGLISSLSFTRKDRKGKDAEQSPSFLESFRNENSVSYTKYVSSLVQLSMGKTKPVPSKGKTETDRAYNQLVKTITAKTRLTNYKKIKKYL